MRDSIRHVLATISNEKSLRLYGKQKVDNYDQKICHNSGATINHGIHQARCL